MSAGEGREARIESVPGQPGWFEVCLGGGTYCVNEHSGECTCLGWEYRCAAEPGRLCKHGAALAAHLNRGHLCPFCLGLRIIAVPCPECHGRGRRDG